MQSIALFDNIFDFSSSFIMSFDSTTKPQREAQNEETERLAAQRNKKESGESEKRTIESKKVGPFGYFKNWAPKVTQKPPWAKKPLKGPRRAKIGTNASYAVQLATFGPKKKSYQTP